MLGDWPENDLPAESFDVVLALESTEHMEPRSQFFAEARRVLRPGANLVVCAWTLAPDLPSWQRRFLIAPLREEASLAGLATREE